MFRLVKIKDMKIVVKHVDILRGELKDTPINEYLVYLYDNNGQAKEAHICYGEKILDDTINTIMWGQRTEGIISNNEQTNIPIELIGFDEFKKLNKIED